MAADNAQVRRLFLAALDRPPAEQEQFVREACPDHPELAASVLFLLRIAAEDGDRFPLRRAEDCIPERLAGYHLEVEIGRGGMGCVFRAADPKLNRLVAIKVLLGLGSARPDLQVRFERERAALGPL